MWPAPPPAASPRRPRQQRPTLLPPPFPLPAFPPAAGTARARRLTRRRCCPPAPWPGATPSCRCQVGGLGGCWGLLGALPGALLAAQPAWWLGPGLPMSLVPQAARAVPARPSQATWSWRWSSGTARTGARRATWCAGGARAWRAVARAGVSALAGMLSPGCICMWAVASCGTCHVASRRFRPAAAARCRTRAQTWWRGRSSTPASSAAWASWASAYRRRRQRTVRRCP